MKLLFVDTETSSLHPSTGQIIEIAGVIADLDEHTFEINVEQSFSSLIALRHELEDKTTRITGITREMLDEAKPLHIVQEKWAEWIENIPDIQGIIGHSIDFDVSFLEYEHWFIPDSINIIDTLSLAKIAYPFFQAVNLEYLVEKLNIKPHFEQQQTGVFKAHRALYDTLCCLQLFSKLLQELNNYGSEDAFTKSLKHFLPLDLVFYGKDFSSPKITTALDNNSHIISIFSTKDGQNLTDIINSTKLLSYTDNIRDLLKSSLPSYLTLIPLCLLVISIRKATFRDEMYRLHTAGAKDYVYAQQILSWCAKQSPSDLRIVSSNESRTSIRYLDGLIAGMNKIMEKTLDLGTLTILLELYISLSTNEDTAEISKFITSLDFFLLSLQPFWVKGEYYFNPSRIPPEQYSIRGKLDSIIQSLISISLPSEDNVKSLRYSLFEAIQCILTDARSASKSGRLAISKPLLIRYFRNNLSLSFREPEDTLYTYISALFQTYPSGKIETFLNQEDAQTLIKMMGIEQFWPRLEGILDHHYDEGAFLYNQSTDNSSLSDFLHSKYQKSQALGKPIVLMCGQNSGIRDIQRIVTEDFEYNQYLLLGESGSLTKIASKLTHGFVGIVIIKNGDFEYLNSAYLNRNYGEIWLIAQPYFSIHSHWYGLAKSTSNSDLFISKLKQLYLKSTIQKIAYLSGSQVNFMRSYVS